MSTKNRPRHLSGIPTTGQRSLLEYFLRMIFILKKSFLQDRAPEIKYSARLDISVLAQTMMLV